MSFISSLLSGKSPASTAPTTTPVSTPATSSDTSRRSTHVAAELDAARATVDALASQIAATQVEQDQARALFDEAVKAHTIGTGKEPDRRPLDNAIAKLDSLRRVAEQQRTVVTKLEQELLSAQRVEAVTNESESLDVLIDNTEAALVAFMHAAAAAREREVRLFALLFDERSGLKKSFSTTESVARAKKARREIRIEAIETAKHLGYKISGRFETDGEWNGMDQDCVREYAAFQLKRDAERAREHHAGEAELRKRVNARRLANPEYQHPLYEVGELVPELNDR